MNRGTDLRALVGDLLEVLQSHQDAGDVPKQVSETFDGLFDRLQAHCEQAQTSPTLRVMHHFACTGGTLMSRALSCQPNTMVLSEVDPFSRNTRISAGFAPSDLIYLARHDRNPPSVATIAEMFLQQLEILHRAAHRDGLDLLLRDHTHSHFCVYENLAERPVMGEMLSRRFDLRSIVTVRHPLDSYVSLHKNRWAQGAATTLEGYARCYLNFLDSYPDVAVFHYEHFVHRPDAECQRMAECLDLAFEPRWQDFLPVVQLSGDSGRGGTRIGPRPRRPLPDAISAEVAQDTPLYDALCARLHYNPDPASPSLPSV